jgi:hypothetical protein
MRNAKHLADLEIKYSCNQTAQFLEVDNLLPSKFKNSFAGICLVKYSFLLLLTSQENNAVKNNIVFAYKMNQLRVLIFPVRFPLFSFT